jgi:hypothetical protein
MPQTDRWEGSHIENVSLGRARDATRSRDDSYVYGSVYGRRSGRIACVQHAAGCNVIQGHAARRRSGKITVDIDDEVGGALCEYLDGPACACRYDGCTGRRSRSLHIHAIGERHRLTRRPCHKSTDRDIGHGRQIQRERLGVGRNIARALQDREGAAPLSRQRRPAERTRGIARIGNPAGCQRTKGQSGWVACGDKVSTNIQNYVRRLAGVDADRSSAPCRNNCRIGFRAAIPRVQR